MKSWLGGRWRGCWGKKNKWSPVTNEPVYLWNVPYSCFMIILQISELKLIPRKIPYVHNFKVLNTFKHTKYHCRCLCYDLFIDVILSCLHAWSKQWNEITLTTTTVEQMRLSRMYAWMIINLVYSFIYLHSELSPHTYFGLFFNKKSTPVFHFYNPHFHL